MKLKRILLVGLLLAVFTIGAAGASDNMTVADSDSDAVGESMDDVLSGNEVDGEITACKNQECPMYDSNGLQAIGKEDMGEDATGNIGIEANNQKGDSLSSGDDVELNVPTTLLVNKSYSLVFDSSEGGGELVLSGIVNGTFKLEEGRLTVPISTQEAGNYTLKAVYGERAWDYVICVLEKSPEVFIESTYDSNISRYDAEHDSNEELNTYMYLICVHAAPYALTGGNVSIYMDGELDTVLTQSDLKDYSYWFDLKEQDVPDKVFEYQLWPKYGEDGTHTVSVVYSGDETFDPANRTFNYTVSSHGLWGYGSDIKVTLPYDASGVLTYTVNGKSSKINVDYVPESEYLGYTEYKIELHGFGLKEGENYTVDISFKGKNNKYSFKESLTLTDFHEIYHFLLSYGAYEDGKISLNLPSDAKGNLTIEMVEEYEGINMSKTVALNKGKATIVLPFGDYCLSAHYTGSDYDVSEIVEEDVTVYCYKLVHAKDVTMRYTDSKTIKLKVNNDRRKLVGANEVVKFKIGKKTFTRKTNKNGVVSFKIPSLAPGKYKLKIISHEDYGRAITANRIITVKHILSVKTVKVKKSAKRLILTASLKKGKTPLKGKKITFKFKGKTYKAKTNKKGVAKVTIKKSVLKKLKVGKKVTYQAKYLKDVVKKSVKVRR